MSWTGTPGLTRPSRLTYALLALCIVGAVAMVTGAAYLGGWPAALLALGFVGFEFATRADVL